jgi:hypothetical protein
MENKESKTKPDDFTVPLQKLARIMMKQDDKVDTMSNFLLDENENIRDHIGCILHAGNMKFRCRVATNSDDIVVLADHMLDIYKTLTFDPPLLAPYTIDEITKFENSGIILPPLLRIYLLQISRETVCNTYRVTINLTIDKEIMSPNTAVNQYNSSQTIEESPDCLDGTLYLSTSGSGYNDYLIVNGFCPGAVMSFNGQDAYVVNPLWRHLLNPIKNIPLDRST